MVGWNCGQEPQNPTWFPIFGFGERIIETAKSHSLAPKVRGTCSADNKSPSGDSSSSGAFSHLICSRRNEWVDVIAHYLPIYLLYVSISVYLLPIYPSIHPSMHECMYWCVSVYSYIHLCVYVSIHLSFYLSIHVCLWVCIYLPGFLGGSDSKESTCNAGRPGFDPWVRKIPWKRAWQPTSVYLPGESPWTEEPGRL